MTTHSPAATDNRRLESLDLLRGLDLFMLVGLQPVIVSACHAAGISHPLAGQLDHAVWEGFTAWDLVMPLFLFMTGAAIPFAMSRYLKPGASKADAWRRIGRRVAVLWLLGMIVQGNLLGLDPGRFYFYTNTLQAIAAGYLIAATTMLTVPRRYHAAVAAGLLALMAIPMSLHGDFSPQGNLPYLIEEAVMGSDRGDSSYTWIWSSLGFGVTVMLGMLAGEIMKAADTPRPRKALRLVAFGGALLLAGWLWSFETPIVKRIWTGSMVLWSGGWCCLLMGAFYYIIDCRGTRLRAGWLNIYGMNSITAYMLGETINFRSIVHSLTFGLQPHIGPWYDTLLTAGNFAVLFLILAWMHRDRLYLRI